MTPTKRGRLQFAGEASEVGTQPPRLVYSNVLWGYFMRLVAEIWGVPGYSLITLGIVVAVGAKRQGQPRLAKRPMPNAHAERE